MVTTRKSTKKNSNQVYNHPVYRDGAYEIITGIHITSPKNEYHTKGLPVSFVTYKGKVIAVITYGYYTPLLWWLGYVPDKFCEDNHISEDVSGRYSPKTVINMLNNTDKFPYLVFRPGSDMYNILPASVLMKLGFRRGMWSRKRK